MASINFFGVGSGLDTSSIINSLLDQKRQSRIKPIETKISNLQDTNTAFTDLISKLNKLKDSASSFRVLNGGSLAKDVAVSDETVLSAKASNAAANTSAQITVTQIASNATLSFNNSASSTSSAINGSAISGNVDFTVGTGANQESISIAVDSTTTYDQFVVAFNNASDKAVASTVNVGTASSPEYKIVISSLNEGTEKGQISATDNVNLFTSGQTIDQATDAQFSISGITGTITRSSNTISDVISGVTLNLSKAGTSAVTVQSDVEGSTGNIDSFVTAYNDLLKFVNENDTIKFESNRGSFKAVFGSLSSSSLDENAISAIKSALSSSSVSSGSVVATLADLGITTQKDGTLKLDKKTFATALSNDSEAVKNITAKLGENLAKVGGTIDQFTQFAGLIPDAIQSNKESISKLQVRLSDLEKSLSQQEQSLIRQFASLDSQIGKLNAQQSTLTSILGSLPKY